MSTAAAAFDAFEPEALARSGVGRLILVDYDRICVTNVNRQVHAMKGTLGKAKVEVMADRLRLINPDAVIETRAEFYSAETSSRLLVPEPDVVIDAGLLRQHEKIEHGVRRDQRPEPPVAGEPIGEGEAHRQDDQHPAGTLI